MIRASLIAAALMAAACTPPAETPTPPPEAVEPAPPAAMTREEFTAQDTCGASQYRALIGSNIAAVTVPTGSVRVLAPDTVHTDDLRSDRINILTDAAGVITSIECF